MYGSTLVDANSIMIGAQNFVAITAVTVSGTIVHFFKKKPPGSQTIIDFIAIDTCYGEMAFMGTFGSIMNLGHYFGQVSVQAGEVLLGLANFSLEWMIANCQSYIAFNGILIFKPEWLEEIVETDLKWINRVFTLSFAMAAKLADTTIPQNPKALEYMTNQDVES